MTDNDTLPVMDDSQSQGPSEQELLDAVMRNSPIMDEVSIPLPVEEETVQDSEESVDEDPEDTEEADSDDEVEEEEVEVDDEDAADEAATDVSEVYTSEDLDLDAQVRVKVDGEEMDVSFGDLLKGYQTDAHLSKKGRELSEAQKEIDAERETKLKEVEVLAQASAQMLAGTEQYYAKQYGELEAQIEKARKDGDTYELSELKDKREQAQKSYWDARKNREAMLDQVAKQKEEVEAKQWQDQMAYFGEKIPELIPGFDEKIAQDIRDFAINDINLDPNVLDTIMDPQIVWALNDYRKLKQNITKGTAKRKAVPSKKALPTKKAPPAQKKSADKEKMVKARAFKEDASADDQMAFLRQHASKTLNL